eukprot:GILJ01023702.1.p1 GENE.GILJ01023702.1~~GILJ01023702.1.p1  ORF type:complete len:230 (-),score=0.28 GILJ01023702.1:146-835(-)
MDKAPVRQTPTETNVGTAAKEKSFMGQKKDFIKHKLLRLNSPLVWSRAYFFFWGAVCLGLPKTFFSLMNLFGKRADVPDTPDLIVTFFRILGVCFLSLALHSHCALKSTNPEVKLMAHSVNIFFFIGACAWNAAGAMWPTNAVFESMKTMCVLKAVACAGRCIHVYLSILNILYPSYKSSIYHMGGHLNLIPCHTLCVCAGLAMWSSWVKLNTKTDTAGVAAPLQKLVA